MSSTEMLLMGIITITLACFGCLVWYSIMILTELRDFEREFHHNSNGGHLAYNAFMEEFKTMKAMIKDLEYEVTKK